MDTFKSNPLYDTPHTTSQAKRGAYLQKKTPFTFAPKILRSRPAFITRGQSQERHSLKSLPRTLAHAGDDPPSLFLKQRTTMPPDESLHPRRGDPAGKSPPLATSHQRATQPRDPKVAGPSTVSLSNATPPPRVGPSHPLLRLQRTSIPQTPQTPPASIPT